MITGREADREALGIFCFKMAETTAFLCAGTKAPGEKKNLRKGKEKK